MRLDCYESDVACAKNAWWRRLGYIHLHKEWPDFLCVNLLHESKTKKVDNLIYFDSYVLEVDQLNMISFVSFDPVVMMLEFYCDVIVSFLSDIFALL